MFVFLVCIIMLLIGSMHVKYLYKKDSPLFIFPLYLSFCYIAILLSTPLYIAKNVCFRDTSLNVQWDYTADLYFKPTKYSKILKQKLPSRVIFEMYAYTRIKFM